jgi:hypothetical protein
MFFDPIILLFVSGVLLKIFCSRLYVPHWINTSISLIILVTIGIKGGIELRTWASERLVIQILAVILLSLCRYLFAKQFLAKIAGYTAKDAIVIGAHYGSVSVTTFAFALGVLQHDQIYFEPYMPLFVALMEFPAIIVASISLKKLDATEESIMSTILRTLSCKSISLLLISIACGYLLGAASLPYFKPLLFDNFRYFLAILLFEMGILVGNEFAHITTHARRIICSSISLSLGCSLLGLACGCALGLSQGGIILLTLLASSASYIAAPAVLRQSIPQSHISFALSHALGVTFPFNIFIGLYVYRAIIQLLVP